MRIAILPASWAPYLMAALRIMTGLLFLEHGSGKLLNFPVLPGIGDVMPHGLLTRPTAFILAGFMAVAYFMAHAPGGFFPVNNHGEAAILYCFIFLFFAAAGPSVWSVDKA